MDAQAETLTETPTTRVFNVGVGTFTLALTLTVYSLICIFGSFAQKPQLLYFYSTLITALITFFIFFGSRDPQFTYDEPAITVYDTYFNVRIAVVFLLMIGGCLGCIGVLVSHARKIVRPGRGGVEEGETVKVRPGF